MLFQRRLWHYDILLLPAAQSSEQAVNTNNTPTPVFDSVLIFQLNVQISKLHSITHKTNIIDIFSFF